MSSLMQFDGRINSKGVGLICMLDSGKSYKERDEGNPHNAKEMIEGTNLPVLYEFFRKPVEMWGAWVVFRYLGEEHAPDLSIPLTLNELPRGATRIPDQAALRYWLDNGEGKPQPVVTIFARDDDRLMQLGLKPRRIGETEFAPLYTIEAHKIYSWSNPIELANGLIVVDELPAGALRVSDQAALRVWLDRDYESESWRP